MERPESDLNALEARLSAWTPTSGLDRDRTLFLAGKAAGRSELRGRVAMASSGLLLLVAIGLGGLLVREQGRSRSLELRLAEAERAPMLAPAIVTVSAPAVEPPGPSSYLVLTHRAFESGPLEPPAPIRIPSAPPTPSGTLRVRDRGRLTDL